MAADSGEPPAEPAPAQEEEGASLVAAAPSATLATDSATDKTEARGGRGLVLERARRLLRQQAPVAVVLSELRKLSVPSDGDGEPGGGGDGRCWTDWEAQGWMTRALVEDPLDGAFPLAADYSARFLRRLSQALEEEGAEEIAEPILRELNAYLLGGDAHQQSDSYVTFFCPTTAAAGAGLGLGGVEGAPVRVPLACRVAPRENQVGLKLWEACFVLADFLLCTPGLVAGRHVVELGAGVGLLGLIARSCLGAARVTLTDVDPEVLRFLRHNVKVNDHHGGVGVGGGGPIEVAALDWSEPAEYQELLGAGAARGEHHGGEGRVMLAADCIYDRDAIPSFVEVLAWALRQDARTVALVASTLRNPETYALFEAEVERQGLGMEEERLPPKCVGSEDKDEDEVFASWWVAAGGAGERWRYESPFYCPNRGAVRLCRIRLRDTPGGDAGGGN